MTTSTTRAVLYSAVYGTPPYDRFKPIPPDLGVPAIMYTDTDANAEAAEAVGWQPRVVPEPRPPADRAAHPTQAAMMRHKYWKTHPAEAVDADVSMWIDGSMTITVDDYVGRCLAALGDDDAVFVRHPFHNCIYDEATFSAGLERYRDADLKAQADFYRSIGHPRGWGVFATGANVRRHSPVVVELGEAWWWECVHRTWQDQVSLSVLVRIFERAERGGLRWNTNMPWAGWWGITPHGF